MPGLLEPVVGTRTPLPTPTMPGGPMDRETLIRMMILRQQQQQMQQPAPNLGLGLGFTNPRAVMDVRQRAAGL